MCVSPDLLCVGHPEVLQGQAPRQCDPLDVLVWPRGLDAQLTAVQAAHHTHPPTL